MIPEIPDICPKYLPFPPKYREKLETSQTSR